MACPGPQTLGKETPEYEMKISLTLVRDIFFNIIQYQLHIFVGVFYLRRVEPGGLSIACEQVQRADKAGGQKGKLGIEPRLIFVEGCGQMPVDKVFCKAQIPDSAQRRLQLHRAQGAELICPVLLQPLKTHVKIPQPVCIKSHQLHAEKGHGFFHAQACAEALVPQRVKYLLTQGDDKAFRQLGITLKYKLKMALALTQQPGGLLAA